MDKQILVEKLRKKILGEAEALAKGARLAHQYATDPESKAEDKYDTRGLEASYLAGAQAKLASETRLNADIYANLPVKEFSAGEAISLTALIELACDEQQLCYFLGPKAGGISIEYEGKTIILITPASPLGQMLLGKQEGDYFEMKTANAVRSFEILSVR